MALGLRRISLFHTLWAGGLAASLALLTAGCWNDKPGISAEPADAEVPRDGQHENQLVHETSPYLLLHAHNPVDWYPWGEQALKKAQRENKLIFLSVGYSSCHWCHVMERESFMDDEIAAYLNEHYVCIKVDREERPDIDSIYMTALQIYNQVSGSGGGGGWPMSMFLTPDARPFFGGTYFPARDGDRGAAIGFQTLIQKIQEVWQQHPDRVKQDATMLTRLVKSEMEERPEAGQVELVGGTLDKVQTALESQYDAQYGGFGYSPVNPRRPKFPEPSNLQFLLLRAEAGNEKAMEMLTKTLDQMGMGGIRDHVGGGFHRYSVDRQWQIPHFEKMLYDNGQLASVYAAAYQLTGNETYRRIVEQLLAFVLDEMSNEQGAFFSALDAESENEEGKFYRWKKEDVRKLLSDEEYELLASVYGLDDGPNFEEHYYVLQLDRPLAEVAEEMQLEAQQLDERLQPVRQKLLAARNQRPRPLTDTKILTSWNGLMIRGLADAGRQLDEPRYVQAAERAADFVLEHLRNDEGRLLRTYGQGEAKLNAYLNDYAFLVDGLLGLHRATQDERWLRAAEELTQLQLELFWDEKRGGFFFTSQDHEALLARDKDPVDGAQPSGNSVSAGNLLYLAQQLDKPEYRQRAEATIRSVAPLMQNAPAAAPRMAVALHEWLQSQ